MASMDCGDVSKINDWLFVGGRKVVVRLASVGEMFNDIIYVAESETPL